jgi:putative endonuclease
MFHMYVLRSRSSGGSYVGSTGDLERRLGEHQANEAWATKNRGPWELIRSEAYPTRSAAMRRERFLKTGKGRDELQLFLSGADLKGR